MQALAASFLRVDKRNVWFDGATSRGRMRWALAFVMPACCENATIMWHWSIVLFVVTLVPSILDVTTRSAVAADFLQRMAASQQPTVVVNGTFIPPAATPICRGVTTCRGPAWPFALGDWTFFWTLLYATTKWMLVCAYCGDINLARLKATTPPSRLAKVCWVAHVLALTPTLVELTMFVHVRGPNDPPITTISLGLRTGVLLADFVLGLVPVFLEHVVWIWLEGLVFLVLDLYRQHVAGHASAYAALSHGDYGLAAFITACLLALVFQTFFYVLTSARALLLGAEHVFESVASTSMSSTPWHDPEVASADIDLGVDSGNVSNNTSSRV